MHFGAFRALPSSLWRLADIVAVWGSAGADTSAELRDGIVRPWRMPGEGRG